MKALNIAGFDGCYGRHGIIQIMEAQCNVCLKDKICIVIDGSEEEYNAGAICQDCANNAFNDY